MKQDKNNKCVLFSTNNEQLKHQQPFKNIKLVLVPTGLGPLCAMH